MFGNKKSNNTNPSEASKTVSKPPKSTSSKTDVIDPGAAASKMSDSTGKEYELTYQIALDALASQLKVLAKDNGLIATATDQIVVNVSTTKGKLFDLKADCESVLKGWEERAKNDGSKIRQLTSEKEALQEKVKFISANTTEGEQVTQNILESVNKSWEKKAKEDAEKIRELTIGSQKTEKEMKAVQKKNKTLQEKVKKLTMEAQITNNNENTTVFSATYPTCPRAVEQQRNQQVRGMSEEEATLSKHRLSEKKEISSNQRRRRSTIIIRTTEEMDGDLIGCLCSKLTLSIGEQKV